MRYDGTKLCLQILTYASFAGAAVAICVGIATGLEIMRPTLMHWVGWLVYGLVAFASGTANALGIAILDAAVAIIDRRGE